VGDFILLVIWVWELEKFGGQGFLSLGQAGLSLEISWCLKIFVGFRWMLDQGYTDKAAEVQTT